MGRPPCSSLYPSWVKGGGPSHQLYLQQHLSTDVDQLTISELPGDSGQEGLLGLMFREHPLHNLATSSCICTGHRTGIGIGPGSLDFVRVRAITYALRFGCELLDGAIAACASTPTICAEAETNGPTARTHPRRARAGRPRLARPYDCILEA